MSETEEIVALARGIERTKVVPAPDGWGAYIIRPDDFDVERIDGPQRYQRRHIFDHVSSLIDWLAVNGDPSMSDVVVDKTRIDAVLDPDDPNTDIVSCVLEHHPEFGAWVDVTGNVLSLKQFHRHWRSFGHTCRQGSDVLAALRVISLSKGEDMEIQIDEMGATRFASQTQKRDLSTQLPASFTVDAPVFQGVTNEGGEPHIYEMEWLLELDLEKGLTFQMFCPQAALTLSRARSDVAAMIHRDLGDPWTITLGTAKGQAVPTKASD